jgi:uncharacterized protein (TIGR02246 family)
MADLARAITDELSIRNLVARYADAVNRRDTDAWAATWSKGGEWNVMGNPAKGREAVVALFQQLMGGLSWVVQLPYSGTIEVAGDEGGGRWYLGEFMKRVDGTASSNVGVYHDRYVREGGEWFFARRRFDALYMGPPDLSADPNPFPDDV